MREPASEILAALIVQELLAIRPSDVGGDWQITKGIMPDKPTKCITLTDVTPDLQGKLQATGETVTQFRVQIKVRAMDYDTGFLRCKDIEEMLSSTHNVNVTTLGEYSATINAVTIKTGTTWMTQEEKERRQVFVLNVQAALTEN